MKGNILKRRPTETASGLGLAVLIYGWLIEQGVENVLAAIVAVAVAFVPGAISAGVDKVRQAGVAHFSDDEPHDSEETGPDRRAERTAPPTE
jgi:hypothetical protein